MALKTALSFMYMHPHLRITCSYIQWQAKKLTHCNFSYPESRLSIQISELDSDQMHSQEFTTQTFHCFGLTIIPEGA